MSKMEKNYNPSDIEQKCYANWEAKGYFKANNSSNSSYCIMLPPPNVTGTLHMGHGFQQTLMDILIRYHRMMGDDTLWQPGTDHAGIATQMVVERKLLTQGKSRHDLGREGFVKQIWQWKEESGGEITSQMRRLGDSVDWERERFTMDKGLSDAVKATFVHLYDEGLIYRGKRLVNWDPVLNTAVSDLEVVSEEEQGSLWYFNYPLADGKNFLTIATTRPETMLGDSAVAVHPDDERYQHLIGEKIKLPLTDREITIIADEYVDKDFGSGCVKITPAHDFNDHDIGKRHNLELINILTKDATLNENTPLKYQGLDRFAARKQIVNDMQEIGLLEKIEPHKLNVPHGDRTGAVLEPLLTDQWFMKMDELAKPAIKAVETGDIKFVPDNWKNTYFEWMRNIQDWCISRQLWWGHRIPAWFDAEGNVYVGQNEADVRNKYKLNVDITLNQDNDVLDTWFSSALWPFSTLGWPENTIDLDKFYPSSVLVTGFDIIFFWVARMIMMGYKFMGKAPFKEIYITGLIRDGEGKKMSKSKGNVLDPVDIIDGISLEALLEKRTKSLMQPQMKAKVIKATKKHFPKGISAYGTDALRFTFTALASTSRDICFDMSRMEGYRNFCNKLWNASRFVMMNISEQDSSLTKNHNYGIAEQWIWHTFNETVADVHKYFSQYRFDLAAQTIYDFVWNQYCGWYVELAKSSLYSTTATEDHKNVVRFTLVKILEQILRLSHPIIPFITEEIFQQLALVLKIKTETLMLENYPTYDKALINKQALINMQWLKDVVVAIRTIRAEMNVKPGVFVSLIMKNGSQEDQQNLDATKAIIKTLTNVKEIIWSDSNTETPSSATTIIGQLEIHIPLAGLIDVNAEKMRLDKEISKLDKELAKILSKLNNEKFIANAPSAIVKKEQDKITGLELKKIKLKNQLDKIIAII